MYYNEKEIQMFFNQLYANVQSGYLQLQVITPPNGVKTQFFPIPLNMDEVKNFIKENVGTGHIFYGVNPRKINTGNGTNKEISQLATFWVDIDSKDYQNSMETAKEQLDNMPLKPTLLISSGHGYHAYWVLEDPIDVTENNFEELTKVSAAIHKLVGADNTHDLRRLLRVPGTPNIKDPTNPKVITKDSLKWAWCKVEQYNSQKYTLEEIKSYVPEFDKVIINPVNYALNLSELVDFDTFDEVSTLIKQKIGTEKGNELIDSIKHIPADGDRSTNDYHAAVNLYEAGFTDAEIYKIFDIAKKMGFDLANKYRERGSEYLLLTLRKAKSEVDKLPQLLKELAETPEEFRPKKLQGIYKCLFRFSPLEQQAKLKTVLQIMGKNYTSSALNKDFQVFKSNQQVDASFYSVNEEGKIKFNLTSFIEYILEKNKVLFYNDRFYIYREGVYEDSDSEMFLRKLIASLLGDDWNLAKENEILEKLKIETYKSDKDLPKRKEFLNLKNGMLNLKTMELLPHSPLYYSFIQYNVKYNPKANPKVIDKFISGVFAQENIPIIWEFLGYTLHSEVEMKKLLILVGDGHNGKSKFIRFFETLIGDKYIAHESLQGLTSDKFSIGQLYHKVLNSYADLSSKSLENTENIKLLTGGDMIRGEEKYRSAFYFENTARYIFSCNTLPSISHHDIQFYDRLLIVRCPFKYEGNNANRYILEQLEADEENYSAFLNRCIEGIKRLETQNEFTYSPSVEHENLEYQMNNDSVYDFIMKNVETVENTEFVQKQDMYMEYLFFCKSSGRYPVSVQKFSKIVKSNPHYWLEGRPQYQGKQVYAWIGVKMKNSYKKSGLEV